MGTNGKTIREIAEEIGVSKQAVRNQIAKLGLQSSLQKNGNQFVISKRIENLILQAFQDKTQTKTQTETQTKTQSDANQLYDILRVELAEKNAIIKSQQQTIDNLTEIVQAQAESIKADRNNQLAETLIDGKQLLDGKTEPLEKEHEQPPSKKGLFSKFFGK